MLIEKISDLNKHLVNARSKNLQIGTINGTFDLLHKGHIDAINYANNNCEKLFILVNSDYSVSLYKGPSRPKENEKIRYINIQNAFPEACIIIFDELNPLHLLTEIKPNIHFMGPDWGIKTLEQELVESNGGKIKYIKKNFDISTSQILKKKDNLDVINRAIFLDRDGTIIIDKNYLSDPEEIEFFPQTVNTLIKLSELNYRFFIVSNQSMVGRKITTKKEAIAINNEVVRKLKLLGVDIQESYLDFSHPDKPSNERKPNVKFLIDAASKYKLALKECWTIGDKESDIIFGKRGNTKTIQIKGSYIASRFSDYKVDQIGEVYEIISEHYNVIHG